LSGIKTSFEFDVMTFAPLEMVAPKEKSELERAKEEAEARAKKRNEEEMMTTGNGKAKN
jgi:mannitol-specific phosphotransferase system IIBC component